MVNERIEKLNAFLQANPTDPFINHALALEWIKAGDDAKARAYFEANVQQNAPYVATYYHLGKLMERNGDADAAIKLYEQGMDYAQKAGDRHT